MDSEQNSVHYQQVLKYMQTAQQDNYDAALQIMRRHNFNIDNALSQKVGINQNMQFNNNPIYDNQQELRIRRNTRNVQEIKKYVKFLKEKQLGTSIIGSVFGFFKNCFSALIIGVIEMILPEMLLAKFLRSQFYNLYRRAIVPQFQDKKLSYLLKNGVLSRKPIMFVISAPKTVHESLRSLLNQREIAIKINQSFIFSGAVIEDKQCNLIQGEKQPPTIIICRKNIYDKIEILKRYTGDMQISQITTEKLNYAIRNHQSATRKQKNFLVKFRNYTRRLYYRGRPGFFEQQEQQEQMYGFEERPIDSSNMIIEQNKEYQKVEQQTKRKLSLELIEKQQKQQQEKKLNQLQQERKARKMSIPDEPIFNQGSVIRFSFRLPDGSNKSRNFLNEEKLDIIYNWVETNEEIQFQDNKKRQFDLFYGYPPTSLQIRRDDKLSQIFEESNEKIIVKQL